MESVILLIAYLVAALIAFSIWAAVRIVRQQAAIDELRRRAGFQPIRASAPPRSPVMAAPPVIRREARRPANWEQFMGARLFAWLGGLALFLAVVYAVKFSFDHNLVSPAVRVSMGEGVGLALIAGGILVPRPRYRVTAQTLVAAGIVSLYAVTYACNAIYHFALLGVVPTFLSLAAITAGACMLALRLDAPVVALLGLFAGYLTPFLVHSGVDNPVGLFGYIGLLAAGIVAMGIGRGWRYLISVSAAGTIVMIWAWANEFYEPAKAGTAATICLSFCALYFCGYLVGRRVRGAESQPLGGALSLPTFALTFAAFMALRSERSPLPILFTLILGADLFLLALAALDRRLRPQLGCLWALIGTVAVESGWHAVHFRAWEAWPWIGWLLATYALFSVFPFCLGRRLDRLTIPWAAAALSGPLHFWMIYHVLKHGWPNPFPGLVPAALALPSIAGLAWLCRGDHPGTGAERPRLGQQAWFGGAALFFITLIIPIQLERHWINVGWSLEGVALIWLFHRLPHAGLRAVGCGLLLLVFARLVGMPGILVDRPGTGEPILNAYLYTYGCAVACLFVGSRLLAPPRDKVLDVSAPAVLSALGTVLAFVLLNLEITDYFTAPRMWTPFIRFEGDFAQDLSYTIAWALFALALLSVGIWKRRRPVRIAAIVLFAVTLLKLYLHDLARLEALYRIGALVGVALVAILASVFYQRFVPNNEAGAPDAGP